MMVVLTAPLGLIGVVATLLLFGQPFGFVAMLGVIAMFGIIMRNSVILVDQIEQDIGAGHQRIDAIVGATVRRFRPITLTAAAAVLALIPRCFGPMATALMGGITSATVLTLFFLPALCRLVPGETRRARGSTTMTTVKSRASRHAWPSAAGAGAGRLRLRPDRKPPAAPARPVRRAALPAAGARRKAWPSTMNRAPSRCRNGGSAGSPELDALVEEGLAKPGPGRHRPLAGRGREQLRGQINIPMPSVDAGGEVSRKRALTMPGLPDPTKLYNIYTGQIQARYEVDIFGAARFANEAEARASSSALSSWTPARRAGRQHRHRRHPFGRALAERVALTEKQPCCRARSRATRSAVTSWARPRKARRWTPTATPPTWKPRCGLYAEWQSIPPRAGRAAGPHARPGAARPGLRRADAARSGAGAGAVGSAGLAPGHPRGGNGGAPQPPPM